MPGADQAPDFDGTITQLGSRFFELWLLLTGLCCRLNAIVNRFGINPLSTRKSPKAIQHKSRALGFGHDPPKSKPQCLSNVRFGNRSIVQSPHCGDSFSNLTAHIKNTPAPEIGLRKNDIRLELKNEVAKLWPAGCNGNQFDFGLFAGSGQPYDFKWIQSGSNQRDFLRGST